MNLMLWTKSFSYELRDRMYERRFINSALSKETGIRKGTITKLLGGYETPTLYTINNLAAALTLYMEDLTNYHDRID